MKYRKKPVTIDAVQWTGYNVYDVYHFFTNYEHINEANVQLDNDDHFYFDKDKLIIKTLEGDMIASFGDYIIRGVAGEFYPCKPDIFESTYEKVEEEE